ncbi:MAG: hypothetical protein KF826_06795 [Xanthobacteraceae bacterium]|nr:hypothetical protein [Xanthobacteraceae bacterium]MCW5678721.1 hypothetical protein [Xanthobacteraceae bacterium]
MTPFGLKLQAELDLERHRMANEWFFKWHAIGRGNLVEIDRFDGGKIRYSGISFRGSPQDVYRDAIRRYARNKVSEVFERLEPELANYPASKIDEAINDTSELLLSFLQSIARKASETESILLGQGKSIPPSMINSVLEAVPDIERRALGLREFYKAKTSTPELRKLERAESFLGKYQNLITAIVGIGGALYVLIRWFFPGYLP